jgi:hypothetical protein
MGILSLAFRGRVEEYRRARCILVKVGRYNVRTQRLKDSIKRISISRPRGVPGLGACEETYVGVEKDMPESASQAWPAAPRLTLPLLQRATYMRVRSAVELLLVGHALSCSITALVIH